MSYQAKRELLHQIAPRYREATYSQKSLILSEFVAATGYDRKYAIWLLSKPVPLKSPTTITRPREPKYGAEVQEALKIAWAAANYICAKRLVPFLSELVPALERHGHLVLSEQVRQQLLQISTATADRILQIERNKNRPHGISTTKAGKLLKHQVPIRTFAEWNDVKPGFFEIDLVAHCGNSAEGSFLYTLTLTDVATGWTECQALLHRGKEAVVEALRRVRQILPFPMLGIDSDNGSEFLNHELLDYCVKEQLTFTRGRAYRKNDQCYVEQKNGAVVRQLVGYDRFEGEAAYRQLAEVHRAVRLYVNFFQPSMKLLTKRRDGSAVYRKYDAAQTPLQRLLTSEILSQPNSLRLKEVSQALDPVRLLKQLETLQDALWRHAVLRSTAESVCEIPAPALTAIRFKPGICVGENSQVVRSDEIVLVPVAPGTGKRKYHKTEKYKETRTYRTRIDPFAEVTDEVKQKVMAEPGRTVKSIFVELQEQYPGKYSDMQLRTLQRRVAGWRAQVLIQFNDAWLQEDLLITGKEAVLTTLTATPL